ncbi:MAG: insulinase family protein [Bacteroidota bacterium]
MKLKRIYLLLGLLVVGALGLRAQELNISGNLNTKIPVDPDVRVGKLDNGMTYYIRKNAKPEDKVELRLVVNAGSILEDEDQRGLAHFVEHMAFNGTKNFKKNELVNYLQSVGVEFGSDLNAYTSFDETVYMLPIPSDDEEILDKGLLVLEDWAHNIEFTEEEIDKERGVIMEEWRLGRGASQRMRDEYFPVLFKNSHYAERLPIGTKEVIQNANYETIRKFYKDWYRPDLMAVVAVGDIDPDEMEKKIKTRFGKIKGPKKPRERKLFEVPNHEETFVAVAKDKEASFTQIQLIYKVDNYKEETLSDMRASMVRSLYNGMLNRRLNELRQSAEPPFFTGSTSFSSMVRSKSNYSSFAIVGQDGVEKGLKALIEENERVKRFGFTPGELDRYKKEMLNSVEKAYKESDKTESSRYTWQYVGNFLSDDPIPGVTFNYDFMKKVMPSIQLEEINALAKDWIQDVNRVIVITGPDKEGVTLPSEAEIRNMLAKAEKIEVKPYEDKVSGAELFTAKPVAGKVTNEKSFDKLGVTEITLSNGVQVVLKPTEFKNDEILMTAFSFGGHYLYSDEDHYSASNASQVVSQSGVSDFSMVDMQKMMVGKTVRVSPFIGSLQEGFNGSASPKDFETMLQLIHLYFVAPRKDEAAFQSFKAKNKMLFQNLMSNPQFFYSDKVSKIMTQNHPRGGGFPTSEELDKVDFERAFEIYQDRFADASDFKFFFVGSFDSKEVTPMLEKYLGSLPNTGRKESWKDLGIRPPKGVVEEVVRSGTDPKSQVTINFTGDMKYGKEEGHVLSSLGELLRNNLIDNIREDQSGVYTVGAFGSVSRLPAERYTMRISFPCAPENVDKLVKACFDEIGKLKKGEISDEDINEIKEAQRQNREENLKKNRFWLNQLRSYYYNGSDLDTFYEYEDMVESFTKDDLQKAAKKYFDEKNYVKVVLMPEQ